MSWTEMTDIPPPQNEEVLLLWDDGVQRIGKNWNDKNHPMYSCTLDFGDTYATVSPPKDYLPVAWTWLPPTMERLVKVETEKTESWPA